MTARITHALAEFKKEERSYLWYGSILVLYVICFFIIDRSIPMSRCITTHVPLDDKIPLLEGFILPYMLWFPMVAGMGVYLGVKDPEAYKKYMIYVGLTFFSTLLLYCIVPTKQELRPEILPRENFCTWVLSMTYAADTNTNVCPSLHVIGSIAVIVGGLSCKALRRPLPQIFIWALALTVAVSTVFVKQHSVLDLILAVPMCLIFLPFVYSGRKNLK